MGSRCSAPGVAFLGFFSAPVNGGASTRGSLLLRWCHNDGECYRDGHQRRGPVSLRTPPRCTRDSSSVQRTLASLCSATAVWLARRRSIPLASLQGRAVPRCWSRVCEVYGPPRGCGPCAAIAGCRAGSRPSCTCTCDGIQRAAQGGVRLGCEGGSWANTREASRGQSAQVQGAAVKASETDIPVCATRAVYCAIPSSK